LADHVRRHGVFKPTVGDVASDIALGSVDAGIIWDAVAAQYDEMDIVRIPELTDAVAHVGIGVLKSSNDRKSAEHFVRYLSARDRGLEHFEQAGFPVVTGPTWDAVSDNKYNHEGTDDTEGSGHEKHKKAQKEE
jgi:ABC-type molybdate transport system substrate-binding protein